VSGREDPIKKVRVRDIANIILRTYVSQRPRPLHIHKSYCSYGRLGAVFFAVNGSPPKGFALFIPTDLFRPIGVLHIIDAWGKKRRMPGLYEITDLDEFEDTDTLKPDTESEEARLP